MARDKCRGINRKLIPFIFPALRATEELRIFSITECPIRPSSDLPTFVTLPALENCERYRNMAVRQARATHARNNGKN